MIEIEVGDQPQRRGSEQELSAIHNPSSSKHSASLLPVANTVKGDLTAGEDKAKVVRCRDGRGKEARSGNRGWHSRGTTSQNRR